MMQTRIYFYKIKINDSVEFIKGDQTRVAAVRIAVALEQKVGQVRIGVRVISLKFVNHCVYRYRLGQVNNPF
jgi:hypothetical protein